MKILILGGTVFAGRAMVEAALQRGHEVTLFNRGRSNPDLFPGVERITGDRKEDLHLLEGRQWDAVIDTSGYVPRVVRQAAELLAPNAGHYTFISSLSVYADTSQAGIDESAPVGQLKEDTESVTEETYGPLKALCEQAVLEAFPGRSVVLRPGLIVGPYDSTDRFTYWPVRAAQGGEVLAPGRPQRTVQFIDVRDLAEWTMRLIEAGASGVFNVDGPPGEVSMEKLLETCKAVSGSDAQFVWVSDEFLLEQQVGEWIEMPLWIPESDRDYSGFFLFDVSRAISAGLTFRPLDDTVRATLEWARTRPETYEWRAGLRREREQELLKAWKERQLSL
ncbi:MAG: SDR family oxidoreductase [Chloroflexi bacterium]|jgi:2'-hydroxyisoflavone reductase|nr:SDR family oxidoreductase [Chloroflexota bacterium]